MSIFKHIKDATYQIELLKKRIPNVKNKHQQLNLLKLTNSFIVLLNDCEALLNRNIHTDAIDKLLLARLHSQMVAIDPTEKIDIHRIVNNIDSNLIETAAQQKFRIISLLQQKEIAGVVNQLQTSKTKNGYIKLIAPVDEQIKVANDLNEVTNYKDYSVMIDELLNEFKQTIQWN